MRRQDYTKLDPADEAFSWWIRLRDMKCVRCGSEVRLNALGLPNTHTNSHFFKRGHEGTRFEPDNCDTLCTGCHGYWETDGRDEYTRWKLGQLGEQRLDELQLQANAYHKKDREAAKVFWRRKLQEDYL